MSNNTTTTQRTWAKIAAAQPTQNKVVPRRPVMKQFAIDQPIQGQTAVNQATCDNPNWDKLTTNTSSSTSASDNHSESSHTDPATPPLSYYPLPVMQHEDEFLVCIDVECHCRNQTFEEHKKGIRNKELRPCEVGFTVFDTRSLETSEHGDRFTEAWHHLKTHSVGIVENKHLKKGSHAPWYKRASTEDFLFGKTTWIHKDKFKRHFIGAVLGSTKKSNKIRGGLRKFTFLVFGPNDNRWLQSLGLDLMTEFKNSSIVDIQQTSLALILGRRLGKQQLAAQDLYAYLGIPTGNTHNGGNDSVYEMQAYLAMHALDLDQWIEITQGRGVLEMLEKTWDDESIEVLNRNLIDLCVREMPVW